MSKRSNQFARSVPRLAVAAFGILAMPLLAKSVPQSRAVLSADQGWKFSLGDPAGAEGPTFDDKSWRLVTVPHDWSIEGAPDPKLTHQAGAGYYAEGVGWYRKSFTPATSWAGKRVSIEFDGVAMNATVYLNGEKLGFHPYAYSSFRYDITEHLKGSAVNHLAVRVDNEQQPNSRWYSGSGIYRHVRVVVTGPVHVAPWGVFVSTPEVSSSRAKVVIKTEVQNESSQDTNLTVKTQLLGPSGKKVGETEEKVISRAGASDTSTQEISLNAPELWMPAAPKLYRAVTQLLRDGDVMDQVETSFGARSLAWSVDKGFSLNGVSIKFAGGSVHADNGPLGAMAFDRAEERKVELLKAAGFNAVRTAHNTPSPAFLNACDRLGLLVLDEPFDAWTIHKMKYDYALYFRDWWQQDLDAMVKRDRNHPSIVMWGIGNEIPDSFLKQGAATAGDLVARVKLTDPTRPTTEAFPGSTGTPQTDAVFANVDIGGYNYNILANQAEDHRRVPTRIMVTTESFPADEFAQWKVAQDHPYIIGEFVWTAMDYLGESGIGAWKYGTPKEEKSSQGMMKMVGAIMPKMGADGKNPFESMFNGQIVNPLFLGFPHHAAYCGDLDLTGFRKGASYYRDILWNGGDRVFATVRLPEPEGKKIIAIGWSVYPTLRTWNWPEHEGKSLIVETYSKADRIRLYLNEKLIGEKPTGLDQAYKADFEVPYAPGTLRAVGVRGDREVSEDILKTAGNPTRLKLTADRTVLRADGQDLSFVTVEAVDDQGRFVSQGTQNIQFGVEGVGTIAAVGNGDTASLDSYAGHAFNLFDGRALVVLRASTRPGGITLSATADGLAPTKLSIRAKQVASVPELR